MKLTVCSDGHDKVLYSAAQCPVCKALEQVEEIQQQAALFCHDLAKAWEETDR